MKTAKDMDKSAKEIAELLQYATDEQKTAIKAILLFAKKNSEKDNGEELKAV